MVEIVIPRPPSVNRLWRMGNGRMYRSAEYVGWLNKCMVLAKEKRFPAILGKYKLMIRVARPDKRRRDIDNIVKAASDFLQHAGIVQDDCLCEALYCKWVQDGPEVTINIYSIGTSDVISGRAKRALQGGAQAHGTGGNPRSPREQLAAAYTEARARGSGKKARPDFRKG